MKTFLLLCVITLFVYLTPITADDQSDLRSSFEERYAAMKSAIANRDADALTSLLAPDFTSTDISGRTETGAQMIGELKKLPVDNRKTSKTTIRSIKLKGSTAVVEQSYEMKTTKVAADGSTQSVELTTVSEDSWIKSANGVWLCQSTATNQLDYLLNGQVAAHKTRQR
jgi:ketosteroid isomerase-like protein